MLTKTRLKFAEGIPRAEMEPATSKYYDRMEYEHRFQLPVPICLRNSCICQIYDTYLKVLGRVSQTEGVLEEFDCSVDDEEMAVLVSLGRLSCSLCRC